MAGIGRFGMKTSFSDDVFDIVVLANRWNGGKVRIMTDIEMFESWLPGIKLQINHDSAWGATTD